MSKIDPTPSGVYSPTIYVTADKIVQHFGITNLASLPVVEQPRYTNYATQSNLAIEGAIYRYIDTLPLATNDELKSYLEGMAFQYALLLKQADDGAENATALENIVKIVEANIIKVMQSQPKQVNTRSMVSDGYGDTVRPYSQTGPGFEDIL